MHKLCPLLLSICTFKCGHVPLFPAGCYEKRLEDGQWSDTYMYNVQYSTAVRAQMYTVYLGAFSYKVNALNKASCLALRV